MGGNAEIADILSLTGLALILAGSVVRSRQCMRACLFVAGLAIMTAAFVNALPVIYALLGSLIAIANAVTFVRTRRTHGAKLTTVETLIHNQHLASLSVADARLFFDQGEILSAMPGAMLTQVRTPVTGLYFLIKGRVEVLVQDEPVSHLLPGAIIGESCLLPDAVATASVHVVGAESLLWYVDADTLLALMAEHTSIKDAVMHATLAALSEKLALANRQRPQLAIAV